MKATELRIGNYLQPNKEHLASYGDHPAIVTSIHEDKFTICNHYPSSWFEPIPLTEEWLVKFGMEYTDGFSNSRKLYVKKHDYDTTNITYSETEGILRLTNGELKGTMLIPCVKYVHQLQNLYHALTGEELTIKTK